MFHLHWIRRKRKKTKRTDLGKGETSYFLFVLETGRLTEAVVVMVAVLGIDVVVVVPGTRDLCHKFVGAKEGE
jgi:hypothetical protein